MSQPHSAIPHLEFVREQLEAQGSPLEADIFVVLKLLRAEYVNAVNPPLDFDAWWKTRGPALEALGAEFCARRAWVEKDGLTAPDVRALLRGVIERAGSQKATAMEAGVSYAFLNDVLHGRREPSGPLLDALGLERVVTYRAKQPPTDCTSKGKS